MEGGYHINNFRINLGLNPRNSFDVFHLVCVFLQTAGVNL